MKKKDSSTKKKEDPTLKTVIKEIKEKKEEKIEEKGPFYDPYSPDTPNSFLSNIIIFS